MSSRFRTKRIDGRERLATGLCFALGIRQAGVMVDVLGDDQAGPVRYVLHEIASGIYRASDKELRVARRMSRFRSRR